MVPLLPDSFWEFHDSFTSWETAGLLVFLANVICEAFSAKRMSESRFIRDLLIT